MDWLIKYSLIPTIVSICGWFAAFFLSLRLNNKAHVKNIEAQNKLFKQEIMYKAYCEIQAAIRNYSTELIKFGTYIGSVPINLKYYKELNKSLIDIPRELINIKGRNDNMRFEFMTVYDSHEIILLDFKQIRDEIITEGNTLDAVVNRLQNTFYTNKSLITGNANKEDIAKIENICKEIGEKTITLTCYLSMDFRIELQNEILGTILDKQLSKRTPGDQSVKVLSK